MLIIKRMKYYTVAALLALSTQAITEITASEEDPLTNRVHLSHEVIEHAAEVWSSMSDGEKRDAMLLILAAVQNPDCLPLLV